jgi:hypothetical protein
MEEYSKDKEPGDDMACPLCREEFKIPQNGVKGLPKNFLIEQLKGLANAFGGCEHYGERKAEIAVFCKEHEKKVLDLFCLDCKMPICSRCIVKLHKKHEFVDMDEITGEYRKHMTNDISTMARSLAQCRELVERQKRSKTEFIDEVDKVERKICEQVELMKQRIDREKQTLIEELEMVKRDRVKQMDRMVGDTEQHATFIESLMKYTEELRNKGTDSDIIKQTSSLHNKVEELMTSEAIQQAMDGIISFDVSFTATTQPASGENSIGKVNIREQQKTPLRGSSPVGSQQLQTPQPGERSN